MPDDSPDLETVMKMEDVIYVVPRSTGTNNNVFEIAHTLYENLDKIFRKILLLQACSR